jgi:predicted DNA-binding protein
VKRHNFFLPDQIMDGLKERSKQTGLPIAELIRRALSEYLSKVPPKQA